MKKLKFELEALLITLLLVGIIIGSMGVIWWLREAGL